MTIGDRIKRKRLDNDMTLEELASKVNLSRQTLSRYETGVISNIPSDRIEDIAAAVGTTPAYIMGWENESGESDLVLGQKYFEQLGYPPAQAEVMAEQAAQVGQRIDNEFDGLNLAETLEALASRPECRMLFSITKDATKEEVLQAVKIIEVLRNNK